MHDITFLFNTLFLWIFAKISWSGQDREGESTQSQSVRFEMLPYLHPPSMDKNQTRKTFVLFFALLQCLSSPLQQLLVPWQDLLAGGSVGRNPKKRIELSSSKQTSYKPQKSSPCLSGPEVLSFGGRIQREWLQIVVLAKPEANRAMSLGNKPKNWPK